MKIYTATIDHKHGTNFYVGLTEENVRAQVAEYCREWWEQEVMSVSIPDTDEEVISDYFAANDAYESVTYGEAALDGEATPFKQLTQEEAIEKTEMIFLEMESGFHIALDHTYMDQVEEFKMILPTGEIVDTKLLK